MVRNIIFPLSLFVASFYISLSCNSSTGPDQSPIVAQPLSDQIPFARLGAGKIAFERAYLGDKGYDAFYVIDIDRQQSSGMAEDLASDPALSPDGNRIAFSAYTSSVSLYDIYVMATTFAQEQRITGDMGGQEQMPGWNSDGTQIFFFAAIPNSVNVGLYRQSPVSSATDRALVFDYGSAGPQIAVPQERVSSSPSGSIVVVTNGIRILSRSGTGGTKIIDAPVDSNRSYHAVTWSPDGKALAYLSILRDSSSTYQSMDILVYDLLSKKSRTLATLPLSGKSDVGIGGNQNSLCWSPDGLRIAFNRHDGEQSAHIYIINSDGTGLTQVTTAQNCYDRGLSWSQ